MIQDELIIKISVIMIIIFICGLMISIFSGGLIMIILLNVINKEDQIMLVIDLCVQCIQIVLKKVFWMFVLKYLCYCDIIVKEFISVVNINCKIFYLYFDFIDDLVEMFV